MVCQSADGEALTRVICRSAFVANCSDSRGRLMSRTRCSLGDAKHRPGTLLRRAGTHGGSSVDPGSAAHHAASAARCAASGERDSLQTAYSRTMTTGHRSAFSQRTAPELSMIDPPKKQKGAGRSQKGRREMPGARCTHGPCAKGSKHTVVTTGSPEHPAFPAQWF